jgi:hypothetical protein
MVFPEQITEACHLLSEGKEEAPLHGQTNYFFINQWLSTSVLRVLQSALLQFEQKNDYTK